MEKEEFSKNIYNVPFKKIASVPQPAPSHKEFKWSLYALDFAMPIGTPILAAEKGEVYFVVDKYIGNYTNKSFMNRCNRIVIRHENEEYTDYGHLRKGIKIKVGTKVKKGQLIGYSGSTGYSTYPHLHFGVARPVNKKWKSLIPRFKIGNKIISMKSPDL